MQNPLKLSLLILLTTFQTLAQTPTAPILSRWEKAITPENAWREYPRPQLVREGWQNLNGLWEYAIRPKTEGVPVGMDGLILVPFCVESASSRVGKALLPSQRLWYRRAFSPPAAWQGQRVLMQSARWITNAACTSTVGWSGRTRADPTPSSST